MQFCQTNYLIEAVEPIHVGGQRRLRGESVPANLSGRTARDVDGLPYIPAASLRGATRAACSRESSAPDCDGKGWECSQPHRCASCAIFGHANEQRGRSSSSLVRFSAAHLVIVPYRTTAGGVWLTTWRRLSEAMVVKDLLAIENAASRLIFAAEEVLPNQISNIADLISINGNSERISTDEWREVTSLRRTYRRTLVVPDDVFEVLAQRSLFEQTSVAVDASSGKARDGSLFSVEAIPKTSVLSSNVVVLSPTISGITTFLTAKGGVTEEIPATPDFVLSVLANGIKHLEMLGVGGKRSRGFGRIRIFPIAVDRVDSYIMPGQVSATDTQSAHSPMLFICHSHEDRSVARRLAADLQREGINVWLEDHEILVGDSRYEKIESGLKDSDYLVLLISSSSAKSNWVKEELNAVRSSEDVEGRKMILPVVLTQESLQHVSPLLAGRECAHLFPRYDDGLRALIRAVRFHEKRRYQSQQGT